MQGFSLRTRFYLRVCTQRKLVKKYGGTPVIYIVKPIGQYFNIVNTEYIANKALIVSKFKNNILVMYNSNSTGRSRLTLDALCCKPK